MHGGRYADVMGDAKRDVYPNDERSANYVVPFAVGILCPIQYLAAAELGCRVPAARVSRCQWVTRHRFTTDLLIPVDAYPARASAWGPMKERFRPSC